MQEEFCPVTGEPYVAYCSKTNRLLTNQDIYNSDVGSLEEQMQNLNFTSYIAGNLKDLFDQKFTKYRSSLEQMSTIQPA